MKDSGCRSGKWQWRRYTSASLGPRGGSSATKSVYSHNNDAHATTTTRTPSPLHAPVLKLCGNLVRPFESRQGPLIALCPTTRISWWCTNGPAWRNSRYQEPRWQKLLTSLDAWRFPTSRRQVVRQGQLWKWRLNRYRLR